MQMYVPQQIMPVADGWTVEVERKHHNGTYVVSYPVAARRWTIQFDAMLTNERSDEQ